MTKKFTTSIFSLILAVIIFASAPLTALAAETPVIYDPIPTTDCSTIIGTYTYSSNESLERPEGSPSIERTGTFAYNDEWFMGSSGDFNQHLASISVIASITSAGYWTDTMETDHSQASKHVEALLKDLQFSDVASNKYYGLESIPNSAACTLGHKTIIQDGKEYTLLAIIPRSAEYKQEWDGNFTVDDGNLHAGFMAGRDEILRFTKQYIEKNGITGDVKIWTAGHSRGSALANMVGAFFEAGGADKYIPDISVAPKDVFAYTFATPATVMTSGATKGALLSVAAAGNADDPNYTSRYVEGDTPGAGINYTKADAGTVLTPHGDQFAGIHNIAPDHDIITLLPPPDWNYTHFGSYHGQQDGATKDEMLAVLKELDNFAYETYLNGDEANFSWKTFDLDTLEIVDDPDAGSLTQGEFFRARVSGLTRTAPTSKAYVESGAQEILQALAAIYGMNEAIIADLDVWTADMETTIKAGAFSVIDYAVVRYAEEGKTTDEDEAVALLLADVINYVTGETEVTTDTTVDRALYLLAKYIMSKTVLEKDEGGNITSYSFTSKAVEELFNALVGIIPEEYKTMLKPETILMILEQAGTNEESGRGSLYLLIMMAASMSGDPMINQIITAFGTNLRDVTDMLYSSRIRNASCLCDFESVCLGYIYVLFGFYRINYLLNRLIMIHKSDNVQQ